jgi:hypothetical protein
MDEVLLMEGLLFYLFLKDCISPGLAKRKPFYASTGRAKTLCLA